MINQFNYKGVNWISGLIWQIMPKAGKVNHESIRKTGHALNCDLFVVRLTKTPQIGYAAKNDGYAEGQRSIAAVVSKSMEINHGSIDFICAIQIDNDRFIYIEQAEGLITTNGDLCGDENVIKEKLLNSLSLDREWGVIVAPEDWHIANSISQTLDQLVPLILFSNFKKKAWYALQDLDQGLYRKIVLKTRKYVYGIGIFFFAVSAGSWYYYKIFSAVHNTHPMVDYQPVTPPWHSTPNASNVIATCDAAFYSIEKLSPGGWNPEQTVCNVLERSFVIYWKSPTDVPYFYIKEDLPDVQLSRDFKKASLTKTIDIPMTGNQEVLLGNIRIKHMVLISEVNEFVLEILESEVAPIPTPNNAQALSQQAPWSSYKWVAKSNRLSPRSMISLLDGPGMRIDKIRTNIQDGILSWEIEGIQYVN
jgi:hypothetical protein